MRWCAILLGLDALAQHIGQIDPPIKFLKFCREQSLDRELSAALAVSPNNAMRFPMLIERMECWTFIVGKVAT